mmetsp:Transcript_1734/g.6034  ORF Transcript_1734/g.6034 Transcript_1734/m.6034 type:complete len:255 (+) Transcript_1734:262-1026(+)
MRAVRAANGAVRELRESARRNQREKPRRNQALRVKIISMGNAGVGKSCLIKRYCEEKFVPKYISTIGVDYGVKGLKMGEWVVRVNMWDLAGGPEFLDVRNEFYKEAQGVLLVYDVGDRRSFEALEGWLDESARFGARNAVVVVAGNKVDQSSRRQVSEAEGREWARGNGFLFFETSALSGERVRPLFSCLFSRVLSAVPGSDPELCMHAQQNAQEDLRAEGLSTDEAGRPRSSHRQPRLSHGEGGRRESARRMQ